MIIKVQHKNFGLMKKHFLFSHILPSFSEIQVIPTPLTHARVT